MLLKPATSIPGTIAAILPALTADTNGTVTVDGPIAATLPALAADVSGTVTVDGPIAATLPAFTAALDGAVADGTISGSIAAILPALSAVLDGAVTVGGSIAVTLPALVTSLSGEVPSVGPITAVLPALTASLTATAVIEPNLEITILAARDDGWLPATDETLVARYLTTGDQRVWRLNLDADGGGDPALAGRPMLIWSTDGTLASNVTAYATDRAPIDPYGRVHLRVYLDVNNGAGGWTVTFEYLDGNGEWQLLGEQVTGDPPTVPNPSSTADLTVGAYIGDSGALNRWTGRIYSLQVRVGRTGEILASPDFTNHPAGTETFTDAQGNVWDVHAPASLTSSQTMTRVAILGPLATDECATWTDFTLPRSGVGRTCEHEPGECCSHYRARMLGRVDGLLLVSDWSEDPDPDLFCLEWSQDEHLIRTTGPDGPMYAVVLGRFDWNVERPFTAATGLMGTRFVTSAAPGGRNLSMTAAVENEAELSQLRSVLARPLVLISPSDASEVWAAPVQESVRIVKLGRIRQVSASFIGTGPEPPAQTADVGV